LSLAGSPVGGDSEVRALLQVKYLLLESQGFTLSEALTKFQKALGLKSFWLMMEDELPVALITNNY